MPITTEVIHKIQQGEYDTVFAELYGNSVQQIQAQRNRYTQTIRSFEEKFGKDREIAIYSAPGRTEIGGNHTDHNNGVVLAAAVNLDIIAVVSKNEENCIRVHSQGFKGTDVIDLACLQPVEAETTHSASLIRGVAAGIQDRNGIIGGFDAFTTSDVLRGSGLSSSAAFEVCMGTILNHEYNGGRFSPVEIGIISQYAENVFFGKPSGLMDQTASSVGSAITIDFKDTAAPVVEEISFPLADFGFHLVVTDTKGDHADLTDEYAMIRGEMEDVANYFGKKVLREVDPQEFYAAIAQCRQVTGDRAVLRAHHFFEECRRARKLAVCIKERDIDEFLATIIESGHSSFEYNQNAYSVKHPREQGVSLGLALSQMVLAGRGAWRLQGGGFAGTIQAFVPDSLLQEYCGKLQQVFGEDACYVLNIRGKGGVRVL